MKRIQRALGAVVLAASVGFAGCSAVQPQFGIGMGPNPLLLAPACVGAGSAYGAGGLNAAAIAGHRVQQVAQLQSRFSLASSDVRAQQSSWKQLVERGC